MTIKALLTFDIHACDCPKDIRYATDWLKSKNIPAIYFIPTILLEKKEFISEIKHADDSGIEIGTHGHTHNKNEIYSLMLGKNLGFLEQSAKTYEIILGKRPNVFRAPHWCTVSDTAYASLSNLGYSYDMSPTPQRFSIFSSLPFSSTWLFSKRSIHKNNYDITIIPTSSFVFPLANPTFSIFRKYLSLLLLQFHKTEVRMSGNKVLNIMLHVGDLHECSKPKPNQKPNMGMLLPKKFGGFGFKHLLRQECTKSISSTTHAILSSLKNVRYCSLQDISPLSELNQSRQRTPQASTAA